MFPTMPLLRSLVFLAGHVATKMPSLRDSRLTRQRLGLRRCSAAFSPATTIRKRQSTGAVQNLAAEAKAAFSPKECRALLVRSYMSDQWIFFPCQIGEHRASILFDHGIRDSIDEAPRLFLKVRAAFKSPRPDGLPTSEEFQQLSKLEDALQALVQEKKSIYVGRVAVEGHHHFYIYTAESEAVWSLGLDRLGAQHDYPLGYVLKADESHDGYWKELFPTDDDWQVIQDLRVIETLEKEGDDGSASRCIDHLAYFPSYPAAQEFSEWAKGQGYGSFSIEGADDNKFRVRFSHEGSVRLDDISSHTIALRRKASELEGDYDGWETPICKSSA